MMKHYPMILGFSVAAFLVSKWVSGTPSWCEVISAIAVSLISAAVFAWLDGCLKMRNAEKEKRDFRNAYLSAFKREIANALERVLWFTAAITDATVNLQESDEYFQTMEFVNSYGGKFGSASYSYKEAVQLFKDLAVRFTSDEIARMDATMQMRTCRAFQLIALYSTRLYALAVELHSKKLELAASDILSLEENDAVCIKVEVAFAIMRNCSHKVKNYKLAVAYLVELLGKFADDELMKRKWRANLSMPISLDKL